MKVEHQRILSPGLSKRRECRYQWRLNENHGTCDGNGSWEGVIESLSNKRLKREIQLQTNGISQLLHTGVKSSGLSNIGKSILYFSDSTERGGVRFVQLRS